MSIFFTCLCLLIPPLGIPLGFFGIYYDRTHWKNYAFCMAFAFSAAAYCYETTGDSDIVRYFEYVRSLQNVNFLDALNYGTYGADGEALYLVNAFFWFAATINDPHIVPMVSVFFVYYLSLRIYCDIGQDFNIKNHDMIWGLIFVLMGLNFYSIVNNIRNVLAFVICGYAVYLDCYKEKRNIGTLLLYVIPIFIHSSVCILIIFRLVLRLAGKMKIAGTVLSLTIIPILDILQYLFQSVDGGILKYLKKAISMAYNYFHDNSAIEWGLEVQASGSEKLFKICYVAIMIIACISIIIVIRNIRNEGKTKGLKKYYTFVFYTGLMGISCTPVLVPIYWRFSATMIALGSSLFPISLTLRGKYVIVRQVFWVILLALAASCMALWVWRLAGVSSIYSVFVKPFFSSPIWKIPLNLFSQIF